MITMIPQHFVTTYEEAKKIIQKIKKFWVCNCGCRENNSKGCKRSRIDVCLMFTNGEGSGTNLHEINKKVAFEILNEAYNKDLVCRPFRDETRAKIDGICFCCDDCCGYFADPKEVCDKGAFIESTSINNCIHCGECTFVCHFHARKIVENRLTLTLENCYGCGLCVKACPENCIKMVSR